MTSLFLEAEEKTGEEERSEMLLLWGPLLTAHGMELKFTVTDGAPWMSSAAGI